MSRRKDPRPAQDRLDPRAEIRWWRVGICAALALSISTCGRTSLDQGSGESILSSGGTSGGDTTSNRTGRGGIGAGGTSFFGTGGDASTSSGSRVSGPAGSEGFAGAEPAAGGTSGVPITGLVVGSGRPEPLGCPIDPSLPECGPATDEGVLVCRSFDCTEASVAAHGCSIFNWPNGTEWVFVCDPFGGCDSTVTLGAITEYADRIKIDYTVEPTCSVCADSSRTCIWLLLKFSWKPVIAYGTLEPSSC
jgi:hypothetical protein